METPPPEPQAEKKEIPMPKNYDKDIEELREENKSLRAEIKKLEEQMTTTYPDEPDKDDEEPEDEW